MSITECHLSENLTIDVIQEKSGLKKLNAYEGLFHSFVWHTICNIYQCCQLSHLSIGGELPKYSDDLMGVLG
jgi:hypothetical protein